MTTETLTQRPPQVGDTVTLTYQNKTVKGRVVCTSGLDHTCIVCFSYLGVDVHTKWIDMDSVQVVLPPPEEPQQDEES